MEYGFEALLAAAYVRGTGTPPLPPALAGTPLEDGAVQIHGDQSNVHGSSRPFLAGEGKAPAPFDTVQERQIFPGHMADDVHPLISREVLPKEPDLAGAAAIEAVVDGDSPGAGDT